MIEHKCLDVIVGVSRFVDMDSTKDSYKDRGGWGQ